MSKRFNLADAKTLLSNSSPQSRMAKTGARFLQAKRCITRFAWVKGLQIDLAHKFVH
jgi:hypothetical protein